jgi:class 3 adenylate cyclase
LPTSTTWLLTAGHSTLSRGHFTPSGAAPARGRVEEVAPAGGILVTRAVVDLVAGSGIELSDYGIHELKGVPDNWHLYEVT